MPVTYVSVFDAMRFVNWVHNGQGDGDTEAGAYTMPTSQFGLPPTRNPDASIFLPTNDEWHKAAYYNADAGAFFDYPAGSDTVITCSAPTTAPNSANCGSVLGSFTPVGSYTGSPSPSGTFDQAGNAQEWTETEVEDIETWFIRGGGFLMAVDFNEASHQDDDYPDTERGGIGFRVATLADDPAGENCGNGTCENPPENALTCPADCPDECGDGLCTGSESSATCFPDCVMCGDGLVEGNEQCEMGVPLADSCESLGFDGGTLACNAATCSYDTSDCTENACLPRWARCSNGSECCSGDCRWWGRCK